MDILQAIHGRRSVREFTDRPVTREEIETLLEAAVCAPNHRRTLPWRFSVLGPQARRAYGAALGERKARKARDAAAGAELQERVAQEHENLPAMIALAMTQDADPERREEDYAATMMAAQNLTLAAVAMGLGTHIRTGAVMDDPAARAAAGVAAGERIVAVIQLGEPAELGGRQAPTAADCTRWLP